jgi:hypothetical protein
LHHCCKVSLKVNYFSKILFLGTTAGIRHDDCNLWKHLLINISVLWNILQDLIRYSSNTWKETGNCEQLYKQVFLHFLN